MGSNFSHPSDGLRSDGELREQLLERLRRQLGRATEAAEDWTAPAGEGEIFSSGIPSLDRLLPSGGLRHGLLVEWLAGESSRTAEQQSSRYSSSVLPLCCPTALPLSCSSALTLSLLAAREACRQGGVLVVIDRERKFYPPAAAAWGIELARLIVVRPQTARDALWAAIQSLRSPVVAAAMWTTADHLDDRASRRLQLAAHAGHTLGLLLRPAAIRGQPSWADVQIAVGSRVKGQALRAGVLTLDARRCSTLGSGRRIHVRILRFRGARPGGHVLLEVDDATHTVREAKEGYRLSALGYQPGLLAES